MTPDEIELLQQAGVVFIQDFVIVICMAIFYGERSSTIQFQPILIQMTGIYLILVLVALHSLA